MSSAAAVGSALLVIDVQQALCRGDYAAFEADGLIERLNGLVRRARAAGAPLVFVQHQEAAGPLAVDSAGWQLADGLDVQAGDTIVRKTASDAFHETTLQALLRAQGVGHLVICGLQTEYCIDTTTRRALALGHAVTLVSDGHSTCDNGVLTAAQIIRHHNVTLGNLDSFGPLVTLVPASDVRFGD